PQGSDIATAARPFARVIEMPMRGDADFRLAGRLSALIRAEAPDLVHLHSRRGADLWGALAARRCGTPCILSRRVDNPEPRWLAAVKYRLFDHIVTISEGIRQVLLDEGVPAGKVSCVRSAVDPTPYLQAYDKAAFRHRLDLPETALLAGVVAQLIERKGHRHLLAALPDVLARHPDLV
ncbi:MAG: glycosyltransferase, partial [Gammaproteobacteria bacterium]|nr:glycosyltransferase [Gammaproteobacteria bacterium]